MPRSINHRTGFTLIEMLAVMLLILTVLAMGVPAMFSAERRSYVNDAMQQLLKIHQFCIGLQRELVSRGIAGSVTLTINAANSAPTVTVTAPGGLDLVSRFGSAPVNVSINADTFIDSVTDVPGTSPGSISWTYDANGFLNIAKKDLTFRALKSGTTWKVMRSMSIYKMGYADVP